MTAGIARVIVDSPLPQLDRLLDYRIPEGLEGVVPGVRVTVPLRSAGRVATGYVVALAEQQEYPGPLSDVASVVSPVPVLRPEVWALARAVADRAAGSAGDVLRLAIPKRQVRVEKAWLARGPLPPIAGVAEQPVTGYPALEATLAERNRVALAVRPGVTRVGEAWVGRWAVTLAELARNALARGETAILVVPDHRDQAQLLAAVASLVPAEAVVRWDARQSEPDRARALLRAIDGPAVVVGARSAVYAPAERLGLLAIWNDGDPLLQEPLAPYVHPRDAALVRQEQQGGALVLAGHSRTTDVERLVEVGYVADVAPERPKHPRIVPTAEMASEDRVAAQARIPSFAWRTASEGLERGPVLVQVARPGYSPALRCSDCGASARCPRCEGPLRIRRRGTPPACTWCGVAQPAWRCPACGGTRLRTVGAGSERTADELGRAFPQTRVIVSDGQHQVLEVGEEPALVVATRGAEPIAAGGYAAVLLLDGAQLAARESLRVGEDVLRSWSDAASLAHDDATVVLVGVGGALAAAFAAWRHAGYAASELADRRTLRFPPAIRSATLHGERAAVDEAIAALPPAAEVVGLTEAEDGRWRAVLRFDYAAGHAVAAAVRAEVIRQATARRKVPPGAPRGGRRPLPLRAHFDDPAPFEE